MKKQQKKGSEVKQILEALKSMETRLGRLEAAIQAKPAPGGRAKPAPAAAAAKATVDASQGVYSRR